MHGGLIRGHGFRARRRTVFFERQPAVALKEQFSAIEGNQRAGSRSRCISPDPPVGSSSAWCRRTPARLSGDLLRTEWKYESYTRKNAIVPCGRCLRRGENFSPPPTPPYPPSLSLFFPHSLTEHSLLNPILPSDRLSQLQHYLTPRGTAHRREINPARTARMIVPTVMMANTTGHRKVRTGARGQRNILT